MPRLLRRLGGTEPGMRIGPVFEEACNRQGNLWTNHFGVFLEISDAASGIAFGIAWTFGAADRLRGTLADCRGCTSGGLDDCGKLN